MRKRIYDLEELIEVLASSLLTIFITIPIISQFNWLFKKNLSAFISLTVLLCSVFWAASLFFVIVVFPRIVLDIQLFIWKKFKR